MMLQDRKILIVGYGNMGGAIGRGLINKGVSVDNIHVVDPHMTCQDVPNVYPSTDDIQDIFDVIILAVKPQVILDVCQSYTRFKGVFISVAAGVTTDKLLQVLGNDKQVVRTMPNLSSQIGLGITALYSPVDADEMKGLATQVMCAVGETVWIPNEDMINVVTAISGSGPAYFFYMMEAMIAFGVENGLSQADAVKLVQETAFGSTSLVKSLGENCDVGTLRSQVTSPGGTTESAIQSLQEDNWGDALKKAMFSAVKRAKIL